MKNSFVKENHIGSEVSEILQYKKIDKQTDKNPVNLLYGYLSCVQKRSYIVKENHIGSAVSEI